MNKALLVILATVTLDAIGGGLIFPILPDLLKQVSPNGDISILYGVLLAVYAAMQFIFSPVLGALSDRYGRRPVMLLSMAGVMVDYLLMALTPWGWVLVVGRTIAGITSANMAVGTAYITDITPVAQRAQRFGLMGAMMGVGFIIGPVLGGVLGTWWLRSPFLAAAVLNGLNLLVALFILPESRRGSGEPLSWKALNPLAPLVWLWEFKPLLPLVVVSVVFGLIAAVPGTIWVLYTADRFGWDAAAIGVSLSIFGVTMAVSQALLTGFFSKHLGDLGTILLGVAFDVLAYLLMGFADQGWMGFAVTPLFALGGIAQPALQSLFTSKVSQDKQGELAGVLTSLQSLASVAGPVLCTALYFSTRDIWLGTVWVVGAALYLLATPLFLAARTRKAAAV
ncbi:MAG: Tet(A)/Tet(B)/Tet(C) family tetracycline efflux MFS transporter [Devosia sp.]|nr:Tet(A)/Tet(B)/Tet(C) family tetracycline efflux MFS transporter [Devosia sp.]